MHKERLIKRSGGDGRTYQNVDYAIAPEPLQVPNSETSGNETISAPKRGTLLCDIRKYGDDNAGQRALDYNEIAPITAQASSAIALTRARPETRPFTED